MKYLKQIWFEMRHQKMMTWVAISGTALSIFMLMSYIMAGTASTVEVAPESNRSRLLAGENMHIINRDPNSNNSDGSAALNLKNAKRLYGDLDGIEAISYATHWNNNVDVNERGKEAVSVIPKNVDGNYWKVFDFVFIDGHPFDQADCDGSVNKVVINSSTARKVFGEEKVAGREIMVDNQNYTVAGVVKDTSPVLTLSFANIFLPYTEETDRQSSSHGFFGNARALMLMKEGVTEEHIRSQVRERYRQLNNETMKEQIEVVYHEQPYNSAIVSGAMYGSNNTPEIDNTTKWIVYAVLLLLPAINLSSMTRSRLRHRISEIGVRRAFGASKFNILTQMLTENFIITLVGGALGLALSFVFMLTISEVFTKFSGGISTTSLEVVNAKPTFEMLFSWANFFIAVGLCFILNLLSTTVPAWQASKANPAEAISKGR